MDVLTIDEVLTDQECEALVCEAEGLGFTDAPITTMRGFEMCPEIRNNTRVIVDDHARAWELWERLAPSLPALHRGLRVVGLNERFRVYRYRVGQCFEWHCDGSYYRSSEEWSLLTLMVYLNDGYVGGRTEFESAAAVEPRRGMVVVFDHGLRHRGARVLAGTKYVLRTDVMVRREAARSA